MLKLVIVAALLVAISLPSILGRDVEILFGTETEPTISTFAPCIGSSRYVFSVRS